MNYTCLGVVYILIIQIIFKLYFKDNINLNLFRLLGNNFNAKLEYYFNKIIKLNKQLSIIWIWFVLIILVFGLDLNAYVLNDILNHLDSYINIHNKLNSNIINNGIYVIEGF